MEVRPYATVHLRDGGAGGGRRTRGVALGKRRGIVCVACVASVGLVTHHVEPRHEVVGVAHLHRVRWTIRMRY